MATSNPLVVAASTSATRAVSAFTPELSTLGPDPQDAGIAGPRTDRCAAREVSGELGYGCVDWFLYATDPAVPVVTHLAPNE